MIVRQQRGFTILELLMVLAVGAAIIPVTITAIFQMSIGTTRINAAPRDNGGNGHSGPDWDGVHAEYEHRVPVSGCLTGADQGGRSRGRATCEGVPLHYTQPNR